MIFVNLYLSTARPRFKKLLIKKLDPRFVTHGVLEPSESLNTIV